MRRSTQQERASEDNTALIKFVQSLVRTVTISIATARVDRTHEPDSYAGRFGTSYCTRHRRILFELRTHQFAMQQRQRAGVGSVSDPAVAANTRDGTGRF